jgi:aminopeptidase-like protein
LTETGLPQSGVRMFDLMSTLWPLHRTLNCADMDKSLDIVGDYIGDARWQIHEFEPKSDALTWWVPERFEVREAWLDVGGRRIADFSENPLHLLSYSLPQRFKGTLGEFRNHIWSNPERPNAIPWEFKYYERSWGFCVRHRDIANLPEDTPVRGVIDVAFTDENFRLGEIYLPGTSDRDILFLTNICHPCQVNDSLSGMVVGAELLRELCVSGQDRKYGLRLLVVPETIGTIAWFHRFPELVKRIDYAWFCEMVGHENSFILQLSRQEDSLIDRAFQVVMRNFRKHGNERTGKFRQVVASDEAVTNGPGFDIPTPSLTRWPYDEYHTSDDNPNIVKPENLDEALSVVRHVINALEENYWPLRKFEGPLMLSRYGLWVDWREDWDLNLKTEQIMFNLEGEKSLIDIAYELDLPFESIYGYLDRLYEAGLIDKCPKAA